MPAAMPHVEAHVDRAVKAEDYLVKVCRKLSLERVLGHDRHWAIVGGVVRDTVLGNIDDRHGIANLPWPDIDIAVSDRLTDLAICQTSSREALRRIEINSFGGMKLSHEAGFVLDIWSWHSSKSLSTLAEWRRKLASVDYGMNAVAFVWPDKKIVFHPRWYSDFNNLTVEQLAKTLPQREVQVIRAVALRAKLNKLLGGSVQLGKKVEANLKWFSTQAKDSEISRGFEYLDKKIQAGRWEDAVKAELITLVSEYKHNKIL